jgi:hypothetical protein
MQVPSTKPRHKGKTPAPKRRGGAAHTSAGTLDFMLGSGNLSSRYVTICGASGSACAGLALGSRHWALT